MAPWHHQRPALVEPEPERAQGLVGTNLVGRTHLGTAVPHCAGPFGTLFIMKGGPAGTKSSTEWASQMVLQVRRWLPDRPLIVVADSDLP